MKKFSLFLLLIISACGDEITTPANPEENLFLKVFSCTKGDTILLMEKEEIKLKLLYDGFIDKDRIRIRYTGLEELSNIALLSKSQLNTNKYFHITLNKWQYWVEIINIEEDVFKFKFLENDPR